MTSPRYFVASKGVLAVVTNGEPLKWSFGTIMPEATEAEFRACPVRIRLTVSDDPADFPASRDGRQWGKYHYFSGVEGGDVLRYERDFFFGSRLRLEAKGLVEGEAHLVANRNYMRFITHRFMNLHSVGYILTDLAGLLLLRAGYSPVHCSAFSIGDATVVVLAPPNTGKTLSAMMACIEHGASFIAEDLAVTDGDDVFSVPWTSTFRYYSNVDARPTSQVLNKLTRLFPPLELIGFSKPRPIEAYVDRTRMVDRARITHVVVLERGQPAVIDEDREQMYRRAVNLNRYEFNYHKAPMAVAYEYFNPGLALDAACAKEREILRAMVTKAPRCWVVRSDDATRYAPMLVERLRNA